MKYEYGMFGSDLDFRLMYDKEFTQEEFDALIRSSIDPILDQLFAKYKASFVIEYDYKSFHVDNSEPDSSMDDTHIEMEFITADLFLKILTEYLISHHGFQYKEYKALSASFMYSEGALSTASHFAKKGEFDNALQNLDELAPHDTPDRAFLLAFIERMKKLPIVVK